MHPQTKRGLEHHQRGNLNAAVKCYGRALKVRRDATTLHLLGRAVFELGDLHAAIQHLRAAAEMQPENAAVLLDLSNLLHEAGELSEATECLRQAVAIDPENATTHNNLGAVLKADGQYGEAVACFRTSIKLDSKSVGTQLNLGRTLQLQRDWNASAIAFREALKLEEHNEEALRGLTSVLKAAGHHEEAVATLEAWLAVDEQNAVAQHMLSALKGETPSRASDGYVKAVFDQAAETFELHLGELQYAGPQYVMELVQGIQPVAAGDWHVLDAGCGTGLCGPLIRPYAAKLVGVDLSGEMLRLAERTESYDELVESELTQFLIDRPDEFDLLIAADTFNYFGDLAPLLSAVAGSLKLQAHCLFTLEERAESSGDAGFVLNANGRFMHDVNWVRQQLSDAGFDVVAIESRTLRLEAEEPVPSSIIHARKIA